MGEIMNRESKKFYLFSGIIAFAICVIWVIFVKTAPYSDFNYYNTLARSIASGGAWGDTYTSVGYAVALGYVYKFFGASIIVGKTFNLVLTLISYVTLFSLLRKLNISEAKRKIIFLMFIFFPCNIFYNSILAVEIFFTTIFLIIANVYFSNNKFKYIIIGILSGIEIMTKPFFLVFFFAIFLVEVITEKKFIKPLLNSIIVLVLSLIVISPFVYRNTKMMGQFTFVSNNGGIVLYINNNSQNKWGRWMDVTKVENSIALTKTYKEANMTQKNHMLNSAAKKWIISHPIGFVELGLKRLLNTYYVGDDIIFAFNGANLGSSVEHLLLVITNLIRNIIFIPGTVGIVAYSIFVISKLIKRKSEEVDKFSLYSLVCFYMFTCVYFVTEGQGRYGFPSILIFIFFFLNIIKIDKLFEKKKSVFY
ncbi:hypothetical protein BJV85_000616 [Clostridium acetobutylicum]|uniref:Predicted membrane protein n=1 Tax=Clostridium acetobutylicum (strain ATCC 824 / DSM 792 / JCM 1419 / IAM 19013 / LMG 5710 / NBRC 13948 / NRRL B-527 / VKM B-1787 / 2291 / W) TaxID=272562 RepID=Q97E29_CLOAB|nr:MULTISPECIES: membrane protein [Clostridium]AAK81221.1 Predicted membrane protein [Clostridium acetobutylicum ATCC 824]ADZ22326.1 membrane protein [Clostridium acetobutylicum EA 2018]AEI32750.1 hypothetical protein SMB_G3323 [Clostridium acetobutylicum DSM 1731]AWV81111.1 hypothetical protein DK921_13580 [Clostridium acetobutylicum]MBC2395688.1 hypothetical protein [Clostridium acetobutylicum]